MLSLAWLVCGRGVDHSDHDLVTWADLAPYPFQTVSECEAGLKVPRLLFLVTNGISGNNQLQQLKIMLEAGGGQDVWSTPPIQVCAKIPKLLRASNAYLLTVHMDLKYDHSG